MKRFLKITLSLMLCFGVTLVNPITLKADTLINRAAVRTIDKTLVEYEAGCRFNVYGTYEIQGSTILDYNLNVTTLTPGCNLTERHFYVIGNDIYVEIVFMRDGEIYSIDETSLT